MSKQPRQPNPSVPQKPVKTGPSYAELRSENESLRKALETSFALATQHQANAQSLHTTLTACGVLAARIGFVVAETLAGALPAALSESLSQNADKMQQAAGTIHEQRRAQARKVVGEPGLADAPVFQGIPQDGPSDVSLTGEATDDDDFDDDDKI